MRGRSLNYSFFKTSPFAFLRIIISATCGATAYLISAITIVSIAVSIGDAAKGPPWLQSPCCPWHPSRLPLIDYFRCTVDADCVKVKIKDATGSYWLGLYLAISAAKLAAYNDAHRCWVTSRVVCPRIEEIWWFLIQTFLYLISVFPCVLWVIVKWFNQEILLAIRDSKFPYITALRAINISAQSLHLLRVVSATNTRVHVILKPQAEESDARILPFPFIKKLYASKQCRKLI